jgi:hypothetical protein
MSVLRSLSVFVLKLIVALAAFTYAMVAYPVAMRNLLAGVDRFRSHAASAVMPEGWQRWLDLLLLPDLAVFIGFALAAHLAIGIGCMLLAPRRSSVRRSSRGAAPAEKQPISRW